MNVILFETLQQHKTFLPLTFTRPLADIRSGILTFREKWEKHLHQPVSVLTVTHLQKIHSPRFDSVNTYVNAALQPTFLLINMLEKLPNGSVLKQGHNILAFRTDEQHLSPKNIESFAASLKPIEFPSKAEVLMSRWDIFNNNAAAIQADFEFITFGRKSAALSTTNILIGSREKIFIEEGAVAEASVFNTNTGCIYIGKDAEVMEGCVLRGPVALCDRAVLKMSAKIYGATTIGPHCKVGGEVNNSVFFAYSNKAHDGFIGNSVIGAWCNLGADTNNSNLKNNYAEVDLWCYAQENNLPTGLQFCGLIMGDHSKSGINTMFNTGTTVGVCANIFGADFPPKFIPSFSWGGAQWLRTFTFEKGLEAIHRMMERRNLSLADSEKEVLRYIFDYDAKWRK